MKKTQPCSSMEEISKHYSAGDRSVLDGHFESCPQCSKVWDELDTIRQAALDAPTYTPSASQAEHIENQLLSQVLQTQPQPKSSLRRFAIPIAACLAAGVAFSVTSQTPSTNGARSGSVVAKAGSSFEHFTRFESNNTEAEIVRVRNGQVHLDVAKLADNKSFKVVTSNGEVEVWGTSFDVIVKEDRLMAVNVTEGVVALRIPGQDERVLRAGQDWKRGAETEPSAALVADDPVLQPKAPEVDHTDADETDDEPQHDEPIAEPDVPSAPVAAKAKEPAITRAARAPSVTKSFDVVEAPEAVEALEGPVVVEDEPIDPEEPSLAQNKTHEEQDSLRPGIEIPEVTPPAEDYFATGWSALKANEPKRAATAFAQAAELAAGQALAEDASYWYAVALVRAKDRRANSAVQAFLERYATSDRAPEAWVMRGWQHQRNGQREAARTAFETARQTGRDDVKRAAEAGLAKLED